MRPVQKPRHHGFVELPHPPVAKRLPLFRGLFEKGWLNGECQESKPLPTGFRDAPNARPPTCSGVRHRIHFANCGFLRRCSRPTQDNRLPIHDSGRLDLGHVEKRENGQSRALKLRHGSAVLSGPIARSISPTPVSATLDVLAEWPQREDAVGTASR